jgi:glycosyltransferase involved in cell wall biosynthesis
VESGIAQGRPCLWFDKQNGALGWFLAVFKYLWVCLRTDFQVLFLQKAMIMTLPCLLLAKFRGKHVVIDFDDLDSEWQPLGWKRRIMRLGERLMPQCADVLTTHNEYLKAYLGKVFPKPIMIIPQGVDTGLFSPKRFSKTAEKEALGLGGKTVLCFLGSFTRGSAADLDIILEAFKIVAERDRHMVLMIVGGEGPLEGHYFQTIASLGVKSRVIITGRKDQNLIPPYLRAADYGLICMRDNLPNSYRVSLKLLEYLSMDLTVIGHLVGGSKDALASYCVLCDPSAPVLAQTIFQVAKGGIEKERARDFVVEHFDWESFVPLVDHVIDQCTRVEK